jgi:hypothetical protein
MDAGAAPPKKKGGCLKIGLIILIILVVLGIIGAVVGFFACRSCFAGLAAGDPVVVGTPLVGSMGPSGVTVNGQPRIDHPLTIETAGTYTITLVSADTGTYDPRLILLQGSNEIAENDDADGLNSRITQELQPGEYTVRVSAYRERPSTPVAYTLTVTPPGGAAAPPAGGGAAPPAGGGAAPPAGGGGGSVCDRYAACCTAYTNALSKVAGVPPAAIESQRASCGQIEALKTSPAADASCTTGLNGLKGASAAYKAMPGFVWPAECN